MIIALYCFLFLSFQLLLKNVYAWNCSRMCQTCSKADTVKALKEPYPLWMALFSLPHGALKLMHSHITEWHFYVFKVCMNTSVSSIHFWHFIILLIFQQALAVFFLYVRSTAINPADPGILVRFDGKLMKNSKNNLGFQGTNLQGNTGEGGTGMHYSPSSASRSSMTGNCNIKTPVREASGVDIPMDHGSKESRSCFNIGGLFCALFVKEDCCRHEGITEQQTAGGEDALFCTLCNAEVLVVLEIIYFYLEQYSC